MSNSASGRMGRRTFLAGAAVAGCAAAGTGYWLSRRRVSRSPGKKVIVIGCDGMDPKLCAELMQQGLLPNLAKIRAAGGFSNLATSIPPQSPVAWASFINGAGPGSHGIFDFIHRHPQEPCKPVNSAAETLPGEGFWEVGDHKLQLDFWPFNHKPPKTVLCRQGTPFWDYLDAAGVPSTFYDLPSNYPPSPSHYGHHRCLSGMGTPDMLGTYGTYQYFSEDSPAESQDLGGGIHTRLAFDGDSAKARLTGPEEALLKTPRPTTIEFEVHRDAAANAVLVEVQGTKLLLKTGQWSRWLRLDFSMSTPPPLPSQHAQGICRFYLQGVSPQVRLYVSPINIDPSAPAVRISEPAGFVSDISSQLGSFYTTGFQEDHRARYHDVFLDEEFLRQATFVLDERLALFDYAIDNYDGGLLFFYFSSSDLQSHIFWWNTNDPHPTRSDAEVQKYFGQVKQVYQRLDVAVGDVVERYGDNATIFVISDHGFANFGRQFNLNRWLRDFDFLNPRDCSSVLQNADWSRTKAYGLGINGLYLNLKGREPNGIVEPGEERERLMKQLVAKLQAVRDFNGQRVISRVYRADQVYSGDATELAPDLIVGYAPGYRASWDTCLGDVTEEVFSDNKKAWSADHCVDAMTVPGVLFCNQKLRAAQPALVDLAPSILAEFGLPTPPVMTGKNLFL